MIVLGLILLVVGYLIGIHLLVTVGWILLIIGVLLLVLAQVGRPVGGRNWW